MNDDGSDAEVEIIELDEPIAIPELKDKNRKKKVTIVSVAKWS